MQYSDFQGLKISRLGFGLMRLPMRADKTVDEEQCAQMFDYAVSHGVNYFDTAYPYLNGLSELVAGRLLKKYPRESYYLADKFPGHQISETHYPEPLFEEQLQKCHVDYFDFYLMHNVYENSIDVYEDARWGIVDYFVRQKEAGRIRLLMRMDYPTMHLFRLSRMERNRILELLLLYYRLHLPDFPALRSLSVLQQVYQ